MSNKWIYPVLGIGIASAIVYVFVFKKDKSYEPPPAPNPEDFLGEIDFITTFGGSQNENIVSVVQASDGGYVLMGTTDSTDGDITGKNGTDDDFWLLKTTQEGEIVFNK